MSEHHYWHFRRVMRVAVAIALATVAYCLSSASATESTVKVAKTGTNYSVSEALLIADTGSSSLGAEPLGLRQAKTSSVLVTPLAEQSTAPLQNGAAETLSNIEAAAGEVGANSAYANQNVYELILSVRRKSDILSNTLLGLQKGFDYYVPASELARILKFPSSINQTGDKIQGYIFSPANTYTIDIQNNTYTVAGETASLPEGSIVSAPARLNTKDVFISPEALNAIWQLDLALDFSQLSLKINTPRKLPYEQARARQKLQDQLEGKNTDEPDLDLIHVPSGYRMLAPHTLRVTNNAQWVDSEFTNTLSLSGDGDLLGTTADYNINLQSDSDDNFEAENVRLRFTREDDGSGRTLPMGLRVAQAGDVSARVSPLISSLFSGRGAYVSSNKRSRQRQAFDLITIEDSAQPGWEVELYRGRELIDFNFVAENGLFTFTDIPLNYGKNIFRIVLYGPQGQIEERTEEYTINQNNIRPGETTFEAGVFDTRKPLIDVGDTPTTDANDGWSQFLRVDRGFKHWLGGFATYSSTPSQNGDKQYLSLGANINAFNGTAQVEAYKELDGGTAADLRFVKRFAGINTNSRLSLYNDFESTESGFGDNAKTFEGEFRAVKNVETDAGLLGITFDTRHTRRENGRHDTRIGNTQSLALENTKLSNSIVTSLSDDGHRSTDGQFTTNTYLSPNWNFRSLLQYDFFPDTELDSFRGTLRYSDLDDFTAALTLNQGIKDSDNTRADLTASYDFGSFLGGAEIGWERSDGFDFLLRADTTFGPNGEDGAYEASSQYKGYTTALEAKLYKDLDKDGEFTEADQPVEGVRLRVNRRKTDPSNKDGYIQLIGAGVPGEATVTLDRDSMPDPFLVPEQDGYSVVLRPGTKPFINFPLYASGSIDGTVRNADGSSMSGMIVQLLDENGTFIREVPTLFDGFYVFEYVRPGTYIVQVSPAHQVNVPPKTVKVTSDDLFAYGVDLILLEQAAEVSATDNDSVVGDGGRVAQLNHAPVADGTLQPAPFSSDGQFDAVVKSVRIGEHPYKVRLVLDLSEPTTYRITAENERQIINIDLPKTAWDATREWKLDKHPMFEKCEVFSINNGTGTRLRLSSRKAVGIFYNASIPAENNLPDRIYVDFLRK